MKRAEIHIVSMIFVLIMAADLSTAWAQRSVGVMGRAEMLVSGQRIALVIGNSTYKFSSLRNPANDARDMAAALRRSDFRVSLLIDADRKAMEKAIRRFGNDLKRSGVGLFYFAGHGIQVNGVNYLIPIGADIGAEDEVEYEGVAADRVLSKMESAGNPLNMVFLDACRNNPFARSFRSSGRGLAAVKNAPKGSVISYATGAGDVADDGTGRNGIYTRNLLRFMRVPGLELSQMMKRVRSGVQKDTGDRQTPYELSSLTGDFYFAGAQPLPPPKLPPAAALTEKPTAPEKGGVNWGLFATGGALGLVAVQQYLEAADLNDQAQVSAQSNPEQSQQQEDDRDRAFTTAMVAGAAGIALLIWAFWDSGGEGTAQTGEWKAAPVAVTPNGKPAPGLRVRYQW